MVAAAIQNWLEQGDLWGIFGHRLGHPSAVIQCHHAVLKVEEFYYDGNGISSETRLKIYWERHELLWISHLAPLPKVDFPNQPQVVTELTQLMITEFDRQQSNP